MPTHSKAYKWLRNIAWEAFNGRKETATCLLVVVVVFVECGIVQACIVDTVNNLLSTFLVIVGSELVLKPPSLLHKKKIKLLAPLSV